MAYFAEDISQGHLSLSDVNLTYVRVYIYIHAHIQYYTGQKNTSNFYLKLSTSKYLPQSVYLKLLNWLKDFGYICWGVVGFPESSVGKESACNAGDPSSIPGSGRSTREGIDYPPQCSWASLVAQLAKNLPAVWETWVRSLGWEDPLEKGKAILNSSILA